MVDAPGRSRYRWLHFRADDSWEYTPVQFFVKRSVGADRASGRFTVKKEYSEKIVTADGWRHDRVQLLPVNPAFEPITLEPEDADALTIVGKFVGTNA